MLTVSPLQTTAFSARPAFQSVEQRAVSPQARSLDRKVDNEDVKSKFQDFVAGTFYKQMLKSFRKMHGKPAYLYGGQAEEIFQAQMDQEVAENLARTHGSAFADPLFQSFVNRRGGQVKN